jgi:phage antirepressor YoqD-like protein
MSNLPVSPEERDESLDGLSKKLLRLNSKELLRVLGGTITEQQKTIEKLKPKAEFFDRVTKTAKLLDLSKCAKILDFKNVGRNNLFSVLRDVGILQHNNEPYQKFVNAGYFSVKEKEHEISPGWVKVYTQTFVTQKGMDFIRRTLERYGFEYNGD